MNDVLKRGDVTKRICCPRVCRLKINIKDEPTWRCHHNPLVGALRIQEPVILGEKKAGKL